MSQRTSDVVTCTCRMIVRVVLSPAIERFHHGASALVGVVILRVNIRRLCGTECGDIYCALYSQVIQPSADILIQLVRLFCMRRFSLVLVTLYSTNYGYTPLGFFLSFFLLLLPFFLFFSLFFTHSCTSLNITRLMIALLYCR
jgi:hypothetical protein